MQVSHVVVVDFSGEFNLHGKNTSIGSVQNKGDFMIAPMCAQVADSKTQRTRVDTQAERHQRLKESAQERGVSYRPQPGVLAAPSVARTSASASAPRRLAAKAGSAS